MLPAITVLITQSRRLPGKGTLMLQEVQRLLSTCRVTYNAVVSGLLAILSSQLELKIRNIKYTHVCKGHPSIGWSSTCTTATARAPAVTFNA